MGMEVTTIGMLVVECLDVGLGTISKIAMQRGMSDLVYVSYSNALAIFFLLPYLFFHHTKPSPPTPLSSSILLRILLLAQISCCLQLFINYGIWYSSPTLSSAMLDLTPAFTFLLALISRMESLDIRAKSCWAKSIGTVVSIVGALTVSLYKGIPFTKLPFLHTNSTTNLILSNVNGYQQQQPNWAFGGILLAGGALSLSLLYIVQTWIMKDYPEEIMVTLISCAFVTFQSTIIAFLAEKEPNAWTLKLDVELITICYSALFSVAIRNIVHTWACKRKGPVYVSMFKPIGMVFALVLGVSFLGDTLYLGSLIGAAIIATGFYTVIWGKAPEEEKKKMVVAKDCKNIDVHSLDEESSPNFPLLKNKNIFFF